MKVFPCCDLSFVYRFCVHVVDILDLYNYNIYLYILI